MSKKSANISFWLQCALVMSFAASVATAVQAQTVPSTVTAKPSATETAAEKAIAAVQIEKIVGQLLSSIDPQALSAVAEQAAQDIAAGKPVQANNSKALQDLQSAVQQQASTLGPVLVRSFISMLAPMLGELKAEIASSLKAD